MLTFEEFFVKKKIDLARLQQAEPALFNEFKSDFAQMGDKSFDHSKKFWFNKIRRTYRLKEEPKPAKTVIEKTEIASQAEDLTSPTIEQKPAYAPKFKPRVSVQPKAEETPITTENTIPSESLNSENTSTEEKKPAFTPRFKMKNVAAKPEEQSSEPETKPVEPSAGIPAADAKPAFKPRFNMKNIAAAKSEESVIENESKPAAELSVPETSGDQQVKPAFKPRFNMKNIQAKPEEKPAEPSPESNPTDEEKPEAKPAFKPRFNMKNIKPKPEEE